MCVLKLTCYGASEKLLSISYILFVVPLPGYTTAVTLCTGITIRCTALLISIYSTRRSHHVAVSTTSCSCPHVDARSVYRDGGYLNICFHAAYIRN